MIVFSSEQIKKLAHVARGDDLIWGMKKTNNGEFVEDYDVILEDDGRPSGLSISFLSVDKKGNAGIVVTLKRTGEGKTYNLRDLKFDMESLLGLLKKFGVKKSKVVISLDEKMLRDSDGPKYSWSDFTLGELSAAENLLKEKYNCEWYYSEYFADDYQYISGGKESKMFEKWFMREDKRLWTLDQVKKANFAIDELVKIIKKKELSPLEAMHFIFAFSALNFKYGSLKKNKNRSNTIVAAINRKKIKCVGYSQFLNAIVGELYDHFANSGDVLISESLSSVKCSITPEWSHAFNVVYIKDSKYDLDGRYVSDLCWGVCLSESLHNDTMFVPDSKNKSVIFAQDYIRSDNASCVDFSSLGIFKSDADTVREELLEYKLSEKLEEEFRQKKVRIPTIKELVQRQEGREL